MNNLEKAGKLAQDGNVQGLMELLNNMRNGTQEDRDNVHNAARYLETAFFNATPRADS